MDALMGLVIAAMIVAGVWVGYHAWQETLLESDPHESAEAHRHANAQPAPPFRHAAVA